MKKGRSFAALFCAWSLVDVHWFGHDDPGGCYMKIDFVAWVAALAVPVLACAAPLPRAVVDSDYISVDPAEAELGQLLFYDPILSGNQEVSCATCHHPAFATGDGLSLGMGDGGLGLGTYRVVDPENPPEERIPRNAPALFNLGAEEFTVLFHDGRIEVDPTRPGGLRTPLDDDMTLGFDSILSAQTMFPVLSSDEMAGHLNENDVSIAVRRGVLTGPGGAWDIISNRVAALPEYVAAFTEIYPHIEAADDIGFTDISNAIAAFMAFEWRSDTAPFDAFLHDEAELSAAARKGLALFYGEMGCSTCHAGPFLTDHQFHAMGAIQIGPGKAAPFEAHHRDEGRFRVTGDPADLYAFRTPSLRNVVLTGPYGHAGAHQDLSSFIKDHLDPETAYLSYSIDQAILPEMPVADLLARGTWVEVAMAAQVTPTTLSDSQVKALLAFLDSLTDPIALTGRLGIPDSVPSGLPVARLK